MRIVAAVAAVAGAVVVMLAVARLARLTFRDHRALRALGWTRGQFVSTAVLVFGPAVLLGVVVGLVLGTAIAPRALVGLSGRVDPHPRQILVNGGIALLVGLAALVLGLVAAAVAGHRSRRVETRRTRPVPRLLRLDRPLPGVLGVRRALTGESRARWSHEPRRHRGARTRRCRRGGRAGRERVDRTAPDGPDAERPGWYGP